MATKLRQVLDYFDNNTESISLSELARELGIEREMLDEMIAYWVRKGKLREVLSSCDDDERQTCGCGSGPSKCPFVATMPRTYERVRDDKSKTVSLSDPLSVENVQ
jgi:hypothetical protein